MSLHNPPRGGTPVARMEALGPIEAAAVLYLRLCHRPDARGTPQAPGAIDALAAEAGPRAAEALTAMMTMLADHGRRPVSCHRFDCACVGADEACFAQIVAAAAEGAMEDAMLIAALMVRADLAVILAQEAQRFGLALDRVNRRMRAARHWPQTSGNATVH